MGIHGRFLCMLLLRLLMKPMWRSTWEQGLCPDHIHSMAVGSCTGMPSCQPGIMIIADALAYKHQCRWPYDRFKATMLMWLVCSEEARWEYE